LVNDDAVAEESATAFVIARRNVVALVEVTRIGFRA
jgi:hypothetical protein